MRLIAAALFVCSGVPIVIWLLSALGLPPWTVAGSVIFAPLWVALAYWLFAPRGPAPLDRKTAEQHLRELEERDLLESMAFRATRAFEVEEFEDEGLHYFLELADGRVLFLTGQYLYEYEPTADEPVEDQPRSGSFPCTEFTIRRHKTEGYVADIVCGGSVLEPEVLAPSFGAKVWEPGAIPEDGQIFTDVTYDEMMRRHLDAPGGQ